MRRTVYCYALASIAGLALAGPAAAQVTAKVAFTSDYVLRGISQTKEDPAIQGSIDYAHGSGFYVGLWGSNVDFSQIGLDPEAQAEFDLYGGWSHKAESGFGVDLGLVHYDYPGATDLNYEEVYVGLSFKVARFKVYYADDYLGFDVEEFYYDANADIPIGGGVTLTLHGGYSTFDPAFLEDYFDYKVALSRVFSRINLEGAYIDTDEKILGTHTDDRFVVTASVAM